MTQIVYYNGVLTADRQCYLEDGSTFQSNKAKHIIDPNNQNMHYFAAFTGGWVECEAAYNIVKSGFNQDVIKEQIAGLKDYDPNEIMGIVVKHHVLLDVTTPYYMVGNGILVPVQDEDPFLAVGYLCDNMRLVHKTYKYLAKRKSISVFELTGTDLYSYGNDLIRFVTKGTSADQIGKVIDVLSCRG